MQFQFIFIKAAAGKAIFAKFTNLLQKVDNLPNIKCEFIGIMFSIIHFHLTVDSVGPSTVTKWKTSQLNT